MSCGYGVLSDDPLGFSGIHRGVVVSVADPMQSGRIKVRVFGVYGDDIKTADIPWAVPAQSLFTGSGSGYGCWTVPEVGSQVFVFFEGCDVYQPVFFAEAPSKVYGQPSERTTNYPTRKILKTKNGIVIYLDDTEGVVRITHPSGQYVQINGSGNFEVSGNESIGGTQEVEGTVESKSGYIINGQPGATGTFTSKDNKTVTVVNGIVVAII